MDGGFVHGAGASSRIKCLSGKKDQAWFRVGEWLDGKCGKSRVLEVGNSFRF